jgi:hypothetical protein
VRHVDLQRRRRVEPVVPHVTDHADNRAASDCRARRNAHRRVAVLACSEQLGVRSNCDLPRLAVLNIAENRSIDAWHAARSALAREPPMTTDERTELEERLDEVEHKLDRLIALVARMTDDLDQAVGVRESMETGLADVRADVQRGFTDLRNTIRHLVARVGEVPRWR